MSTQPDLERFRSRVGQVIRDHWVLYMVEGVVLVILGLLAIVLPPIATLAVGTARRVTRSEMSSRMAGWTASIFYALLMINLA